jgi:hypothetical protein
MNKININSLVEFAVSQIKISGEMFVAGKRVDAGVNKTLDSSVVSQLPTELVQMLTMQAFGADYTADELEQLATQLSALAELKRETLDNLGDSGD